MNSKNNSKNNSIASDYSINVPPQIDLLNKEYKIGI